jgi:hypothetical protein
VWFPIPNLEGCASIPLKNNDVSLPSPGGPCKARGSRYALQRGGDNMPLCRHITRGTAFDAVLLMVCGGLVQGFQGVDYSTKGRDNGPVQFERGGGKVDPFGLDQFISSVHDKKAN